MPSPFPGMDPYLESPDWFPNLHHDLIFCIKQSLRIRLPGSYYAQLGQCAKASDDQNVNCGVWGRP
ncbi:MAG: DUF4058 family protein [Isosphaerales bacterium]